MKNLVVLLTLITIITTSTIAMHDSAAGVFPDQPRQNEESPKEDLPEDAAEFIRRRRDNRQFVYEAHHTHVYNHAKFNPTKSFTANTGDALLSGSMQALEAIPILLLKHGIEILTAEYMMWRKSSPVLTKELERHLEAEQLIEKRIVEIRGWIKLTETFVKKHKNNPALERKFKKQLELLSQQEAAIELKAVELKIKTNDLIQKIGRSVAPDLQGTIDEILVKDGANTIEEPETTIPDWDMTRKPVDTQRDEAAGLPTDHVNDSDEAPAAA